MSTGDRDENATILDPGAGGQPLDHIYVHWQLCSKRRCGEEAYTAILNWTMEQSKTVKLSDQFQKEEH